MRKIFTNIKAIVASVVTMAVVASSATSCSYDDAAIWDEINQIKKELADLRDSLQNEMNAIKELVNGNVTIKDVTAQADGSKLVTLSDGTKISVYPKGDEVPQNVITTKMENNVFYWAYYDGLGQAQFLLVGGKKVPVADATPKTRVNEGAIEVSLDGGTTWFVTGYSESVADSIIKAIEVVYSDWQTDAEGNPIALYCKVVLSDGSIIKVGMQNGKIVLPFDSLFVPYGTDMLFSVEVSDVADYMTTTPKGWECEVEHDAKSERMILNFFAPTLEDIEAKEAVSSGVAKLMVVFNNGSSAIASIKVSTNPATVNFTQEGVYVEAGYGTSYMLCGLTGVNQYNAQTFATACNTVLSGGTASGVHELAFMETLTEFIPFTSLRTNSLTAGNEYIFWYAVPRTDDNGDMYVMVEEMCTKKYKHNSVSFKVTEQDFFDVTVKFQTVGTDGYAIGFAKASEFDAQALADYYNENPDYFSANQQNMEYTGSFVELFDPNAARLAEGTEYVAWMIAKSNNTKILVDNVINWTFSTKPFEQGGDIEIKTVGDDRIEYEYIELTLDTDKEHIAFFYNAMPSYMASAYPDDEYAIEMLITEGTKVVSGDAVVARYDGAKPGAKLTFFAVAVDADGKYGKVFKEEYTTRKVEYNDLTVTATLVDYKIDNTRILVECEGAVSYSYIIAKTADERTWVKQYGGSVTSAGEYVIKNYDASDVYCTADADDALVDGHICFSGLSMGEEYVVVILAEDENRNFSQPQAIYFEPIANIGVVVKRTDDNWEVGKPTITILEYEDNPHLFYSFAWLFTPGEHTTAYSSALYPSNFINDELHTNINTVEKLIAELISCCDTGGMGEMGSSCVWNETGSYERRYTVTVDEDNDGRLEEVEKVEYHEGGYHFYPYGTSKMTFIYTTWVGEDGNFHEPFAIDAVTGEEVDIWTGAAL